MNIYKDRGLPPLKAYSALCYNKYDTEIFDYILQLEPVLPDLIQPSLICATSEVCIYK